MDSTPTAAHLASAFGDAVDGPTGFDRMRSDPSCAPAVMAALGRVLARLEELDAPAGGWVERWEARVHGAAERVRLSGEDEGLVQAVLDRISELGPATEPDPGWIHGDLNPGNLVLGEDGEVRGVSGWGAAEAGDPLLDWAMLLERPERVVAHVARGYGLDRARIRLLGAASTLERYALGRLILRLDAGEPVARVREDWRRMKAPGWVAARLGRSLADRVPPGPAPRRGSGPDPGPPLWAGLWQRRLLLDGNRPRALEGPPAVDVWSLLGGQAFFDEVFDRQPWVRPVRLHAADWARVAIEAAVAVGPQGRVDRWSSAGMQRAVPPQELGDAEALQARSDEQLIAVRDTHWELEPFMGWHRAFAAFFGCPVTTGLYLNGAGAPGFPEHHDAHHVFAIQLAGSKRWFLGGALLPNASRRYDWPGQQQTVERSIEVAAGHLLYMPPGVRHRAEVADGPSVHITLGVHVPRELDWLETALVHGGRHDPALRARLPMRVGARGIVWDVDAAAASERIRRVIDGIPAVAVLTDGTWVGAPLGGPTEITGAWPVRDGQFEVRPPEVGGPLLERAERAAKAVVDQIPSVRVVYARGSVLEDRDPSTVFDLDLAVVFDAPPDAETIDQVRAVLQGHDDPSCPFDARPVLASELIDQPGASFLGLCLAVRSARLAGEPLWAEPPAIPAGAAVADALAAESIGLWRDIVGQIYARPASGPGPRVPPEGVAWLQKRALRLIAMASLRAGGPYTRHPSGCVELAYRVLPERAVLARSVCAALYAHDGSNEALSSALELGTAVIDRLV